MIYCCLSLWRRQIIVLASWITGQSSVCSTLCLDRQQRNIKGVLLPFCEGNPPVSGGFPAQKDSNADYVSVWWRHDGLFCQLGCHRSMIRNTLEKRMTYRSGNACLMMTWKAFRIAAWPFVGESAGDRWFVRTDGQCGTMIFLRG